jgi:putative transposase
MLPRYERKIDYGGCVQLRYSYRLDPSPSQRTALARAFGCARVVFNDGLAARRAAFEAGESYLPDAELSKRLTELKKTPERAWLTEVSSVVLQQALADLNTAYRNFFDSVNGKRKGPRAAPPRFRSRKDSRQAVRFTANSRFKVLDNGRLRLPKTGDVAVRWSRALPSAPSSVTVIRDAAGRFFASFVVETEPEPLPGTGAECGIDLGLGHFAVLDDGTKVAAPRFLRRAEKKLRKAQKAVSRKEKGSKNREKARVKVARAHAKAADARRDFHHKLSATVIRENQAVYVEDLAVKGLARTRLAKSVHDAGVQGEAARPRLPQDRPVRADQPGVLSVRHQGRPQAAPCPRMDMQGVRHRPRQGRQRRREHRRPGTQGGSKRPRRRRETSARAGGCR